MTLEYDVLANIFPLDKMLANFDAWREARTGAGEPAPLVEELPPPPPTLYAGDPASWYAEGSAAWYSQSAAGRRDRGFRNAGRDRLCHAFESWTCPIGSDTSP